MASDIGPDADKQLSHASTPIHRKHSFKVTWSKSETTSLWSHTASYINERVGRASMVGSCKSHERLFGAREILIEPIARSVLRGGRDGTPCKRRGWKDKRANLTAEHENVSFEKFRCAACEAWEAEDWIMRRTCLNTPSNLSTQGQRNKLISDARTTRRYVLY